MKTLSIIALLVALAVVFMMQQKSVNTTVIDQQSGESKVQQVEREVNEQVEQHIEQLKDLERKQQ